MKLLKTDNPYLTKEQWRKVFTAVSIMVLILYVVAMIFSLCGSKYFILNYQNEQMDKIENFLRDNKIIGLLSWLFSTFEFTIVSCFVLKKKPKIWYVLAFYAIPVGIAFAFPTISGYIANPFTYLTYITMCIVETILEDKTKFWKLFGIKLLRLLIASAITFVFQVMIFTIKSGSFSVVNHDMSLSANFIYALEYDIALSIVLFTIALHINREKGDSLWATYHGHGGFSQTSRKQSQKSKPMKNLTKTQKNKLRLFYIKFYLTQIGAFLLLMVLPFLLGKVFEFLVMYTAFAIVRYILGFKYSLHYKKETLCITVGIVVFGILSLAVPFFYIVVSMAILLGVGLAVLLHLSYKYKGFYLFNKIAKPDKFAELYVIMDGDLSPRHVELICKHRGLDGEETLLIKDFAEGNKKSYLAKRYNYSEKTIERKINEAINKLSYTT